MKKFSLLLSIAFFMSASTYTFASVTTGDNVSIEYKVDKKEKCKKGEKKCCKKEEAAACCDKNKKAETKACEEGCQKVCCAKKEDGK